jgi:DNA (cytosine-5)-methyltransferase 1
MPRYFLAENVPGLFSVSDGEDFYEAIRLFTDSGYDVQWQVLNTRWFLPQNKERIIFVGHLRGTGRPQVFPIGETGRTYPESNEQDAVDNCIDSNYHKGWLDHGQRTMICLADEGQAARIYDPCGDSPTIPTPSGGNHIPKIATRQPLKFLGRNQKNIEGDYAFTVDGSGQASPFGSKQNWDSYLIDNRVRRLTPIECERLQGFPDNWTKYGIDKNGNKIEISDTQRYKCCGNAVSTPVITEVGLRLLE